VSGLKPIIDTQSIRCYPNPFNNSLTIVVPAQLAVAETNLYTLPGERNAIYLRIYFS
jgi:hypothetical protein